MKFHSSHPQSRHFSRSLTLRNFCELVLFRTPTDTMVVPPGNHDKAAEFFAKLPASTAHAMYHELRRTYEGENRVSLIETQHTKWTSCRDQIPVTRNIWNDPEHLRYLACYMSTSSQHSTTFATTLVVQDRSGRHGFKPMTE